MTEGNRGHRDGRREVGATHSTAESREPNPRDLPEGRGRRDHGSRTGKTSRTPSLGSVSTKRARIAELASRHKGQALRTLAHHMDDEWLREAVRRTRKDGAPGVDGMTAATYAKDLDANLSSLLKRARSGTYRAPAVRRVQIPKGRGKTRPIGIPAYEDKVLQRAVVMLLEPIYEQEFYDFSFGFRPGRSAHDAVHMLDQALWSMGGGWVLEADIQSFFDTLDHKKLQELFGQRVADGVVRRLVGKWLQAGVMDGGELHHPESGTPQGGVISPLLANIYLHEVLDRWFVETVLPRLRGKAVLVRYADDFVVVFSDRRDAERVHAVLPQRFARFGLQLHPEKTRLIEYRRPDRTEGGDKPGGFDFLGFTHFWGRSLKGAWIPKRKTAGSRFSRATRAMGDWMRRARHAPLAHQHGVISSKLRGHFNYYGIRGNSPALSRFFHEVVLRWKYWLGRRSQRARLTWAKFNRLLERYPLPPPRRPRRPRQQKLANLWS